MPANSITPTDLKTILHSKRANIYYLEKCRIQVNGGRVEYVTQEGKESFYWNIPIANTTAVMLGMGTSVTQMAMREFARAGVMVGFCGTDGTPLYSANEVDIDVSWLSPQSEYRPTAYLQNWVSFWFDEEKRLQAAKHFQLVRLLQIEKQWERLRIQRETPFQPDKVALETILDRARTGMENAQDHTSLMLQEAQLTKSLYKLTSQTVGYGSFTRAKRGGGADMANRFLDQGNYPGLTCAVSLPASLLSSSFAMVICSLRLSPGCLRPTDSARRRRFPGSDTHNRIRVQGAVFSARRVSKIKGSC